MKGETLEALKGSIQKWQGIVDGTGEDRGISNCPLCSIFNKAGGCDGCLVKETTGENGCRNTPHEDWCNHQHEVHKSHYPYKIVPNCSECECLAIAELAFLKSLLPVEESKMTMRKIEIYEKKEEVAKEEPIRVKMEESRGRISFEAVDSNGNKLSTGNLFSLTPAGIYLYSSISGDIGFAVDDNGRIKIQSNT